MTYTLIIGDRAFSSWSLRGWLMFEKFGLPVETRMTGLYSGTFAQDMQAYAPARLVPVMVTPEGHLVGETLAIAETLAERHPEAGLWPADRDARATARWLAAEMHAGFRALRDECPCQLLFRIEGFTPSPAVQADLARLEELWADAAGFSDGSGPWLFGAYSLADVFYAPVAARIAGYGLPVGPAAQAYVDQHLADPAFRRWRAEALTVPYPDPPYGRGYEKGPWPGPAEEVEPYATAKTV